MLLLTIICILLLLIKEGFPLFKNKLWKELTTFSVLLGVALFLAISYKLDIPGPISWLDNLLSPLGKSMFSGLLNNK